MIEKKLNLTLTLDVTTDEDIDFDEIIPTPKGGITRGELYKLGLKGSKMPDFMRPVLFLDHDGVINLDAEMEPDAPGISSEYINFPEDCAFYQVSHNTTVFWRTSIVEALRDTNSIWCTNWKQEAYTILNKIYNYDFSWIDWKKRGMSDWGTYGKALYIGNIVRATGCDWVVIDDDFVDGYSDLLYLETDTTDQSDYTGLIIAPKAEVGLSNEELIEALKALNK